MKRIQYLFLIGLTSILFSNCGDDPSDTVQQGKWLASEVTRRSCDNEFANGPVNCINDVGAGNTFSCVELTLSAGDYLLSVNFDANRTNEVGNYQTTAGNIRLCPTQPIGECYDLPIITSDFNTMTIDLPRDGGCIATIPLVKT